MKADVEAFLALIQAHQDYQRKTESGRDQLLAVGALEMLRADVFEAGNKIPRLCQDSQCERCRAIIEIRRSMS